MYILAHGSWILVTSNMQYVKIMSDWYNNAVAHVVKYETSDWNLIIYGIHCIFIVWKFLAL